MVTHIPKLPTSLDGVLANLPAALKDANIPQQLRKKEIGFESFGLSHVAKRMTEALAGSGWGLALHGTDAAKVRLAFNLSARMAIIGFHAVRNIDTSALYLGLRDEITKQDAIAKVSYPTEIVQGKCPVLMLRNAVVGDWESGLPVGFTRWLAERALEWMDEGGGVIIEACGVPSANSLQNMTAVYGPLFTTTMTKGGIAV